MRIMAPIEVCTRVELVNSTPREKMKNVNATATIDLRGGFANQLFQWSIARYLIHMCHCSVIFDARAVGRPGSPGDQLTGTGLSVRVRKQTRISSSMWRIVFRIFPASIAVHLSEFLRPGRLGRATRRPLEALDRLKLGENVVLGGYLQDPELISSIREVLAVEFRGVMKKYSAPQVGYAAVHVRRGDYVNNKTIFSKFGVPDLDYYVRAIEAVGCERLLIVTDDAAWCRDFLQPALPPNISSEVCSNADHLIDFSILLNANSLVLSNSTFSWWAAFMGDQSQVIIPAPWLTKEDHPEFYLPGWQVRDRSTGKVVE